MIRRPPRSTRTDTLFPDTTLFRSVVDLAGLVEILVVALRPRGGEVDHRQPDARAEAVALVGGRLHVGEEVVLVDAGGAATEHLSDRQGDAVGDEVRADHRAFYRRSEERRGGTECVSTCRSRWSADQQNKK